MIFLSSKSDSVKTIDTVPNSKCKFHTWIHFAIRHIFTNLQMRLVYQFVVLILNTIRFKIVYKDTSLSLFMLASYLETVF